MEGLASANDSLLGPGNDSTLVHATLSCLGTFMRGNVQVNSFVTAGTGSCTSSSRVGVFFPELRNLREASWHAFCLVKALKVLSALLSKSALRL